MSQYISTENEEMVQVASNLGWSEFCDWVAKLDEQEYSGIHHIALHGWDPDVEDLGDELAKALDESPPSADVESIVQGMIDFIDEHDEAELVIVSNGMTGEDESEE